LLVQIDWEGTINSLFAGSQTCGRCGSEKPSIVIGYSRKLSLNAYAQRHQNCARGPECDVRKLIALCEECAASEGLHGSLLDATEALEAYLLDCRRDLEESLDYVAEYWRDDYELLGDDLEKRMDEVDPELFKEETRWRERLEEEYLRYHQEFRQRSRRIPAPGWRSEYVEELRALGYDTLLGD
jgi:hypothetical protein